MISIRVSISCISHAVNTHRLHVMQEDEDTANGFGLCILDAATGEFNMSAFVDDVCGTKLETVIRQLRPKEVVYSKVGHPLRLVMKPLTIHC